MTISEFFIKRPIFAIVLNVLFIVVGLLSYRSLTVREYPEVSTPSLTVRISYPNASPQVIESEVTFLVEDALAEVPNLSLMASSSKEGESEVRLKFKEGTSVNSVLSKVRESLAQIKSDLPKDVQDPKIRQEANETQALIYVSLTSDHLESSDLTHLANLHLKNAFRSLSGVASVDVIGRPYVMEIALDRLKMFSFGVTPKGISKALEDHNVALPSGKLAGEIPVTMDLKAKSDEDFGSIVVKQKDGDVVFLRDVADIRLKDDDSWRIRVNGNPGILLGIKRAGDGNPLEISRDVREILPGLQKNLSEGVYAEIVKDDADFIRASLSSIKNSLIEAVVLVLLIIFLFLRNLRASLIPLVTIPVSVLGTFAILSLFGFSINTITLLALVLAIGLVVDDAIVVLENIFRHVEAGMSPQEAAKKGSKEISFAIVAMTGTLASVYAPIAFMQGAMGQIFVEFAVALAGAVLVSGVVALTLSPMMCSNILRAHNGEVLPSISNFIQRLTDNYKNLLGRVMLYPRWIMGGACLLLALCVVFFKILPGELAPKEDRGVLGVFMEPLTASSKEVMDEYVKKAETLVKDVPEAKQNLTFIGDWGGNVVLPLKSWSDRGRSAGQITEDLREKVRVIPTVSTHVWNWDSGLPGLEGMGEDSDITLYVLTVGTYEELLNRIEKFTKECRDDGVFKSVYHRLKLGEPGYNCVIDRQKMAKADFEPEDISKALEIFLDRAKSTSFYKEGQKYDVRLTGQDSPQDLSEVYVSNKEGARVSLASFATLEEVGLPQSLEHVNQMRSTTFSATLKPGQDFAAAVDYLKKKVDSTFPSGYSVAFTGAAEKYQESFVEMMILFGIALIFIYSILAIQFESFTDPLMIMFTVPLACCGALLTLWLFGQSLNIFTQIGLITLVGLITKHGILLVTFANQLCNEGKQASEAIREASVLRFRPILMTTGAMVFGTIPLLISSGAGSEARFAIGCVLVGGLLLGTVLTLFVIPVIYTSVKNSSLYSRLKVA